MKELQNLVLNTLRKKAIPVSLYLVNGIKLQGKITNFDQYVLILEHGPSGIQTVYKHAISTIVPSDSKALSEALAEAHKLAEKATEMQKKTAIDRVSK